MPLIDVVMTVKNGGPFLSLALDSLAAQSLQDFRLLICNDGSTDGTADVIHNEHRFPVIALHHESSRGIARSVNELLQLPSDSRYIARFDADDICRPDRFARQVAFLEAHPEIGVLGTWMEIIDPRGNTIGHHRYPVDPDSIRCEFIFTDPIGNPSAMARAALFRDTRPCYQSEFTIAEDYDFWSRLSEHTRMANLPDFLVRYRRHGNAGGVARHAIQLAEMRIIRKRHVERLDLTPRSRDLLLIALDLSKSSATASPNGVADLLKELDMLFGRPCSSHYRKRRHEIAFTLSVGMSHRNKLRLLLKDLMTGRAYLRKKYEQLTQRWRSMLRIEKNRFINKRLAYNLRGVIRSRGGNCEPDLRIYGDGTQGHRIQLGDQTVIEHGCSFWVSSPVEHQKTGRLVAGENLFIGFNSRINIYEDVTIGRCVLIGANCYIASNNHNYQITGASIQSQGFNGAPIVIGDDVWIGCHVVIVAGVTIGNGSVIGAGSVVTHHVPAFEVWAGVPARRIKSRIDTPSPPATLM